jgi:glycerol-3-phosphate O-acyltransferase
VYLVPTAIAFDQLYELKAMAAEALGVSKKAESLRWMVEYVQAQRRSRGKAWIRFGTPLSLREALTEDVGAVQEPGTRARAVQKTALEVCHRINRVTPITPTSLVTFALLGVEDRALTLAEIGATLEPILEYAAKRDLPTVGGLMPGDDAPIREALEALERQGVVRRFTEGTEPVFAIGADEHLMAAFYRNSTIHFFVNRAIVETVMARGAEERFSGLDQVVEAAVRLRELLIFEFIFPRKRDFLEALREEMELFGPGWEQNVASPEFTRAMLERSRLHVAHRVLRSFLEAYQVVADHLAAQPPGLPVDEEAFLSQCVGIARQYRLQHRIWSTESVSKELFGNALSVAHHRGLLATDGDDLQARRRALSDEIADHVGRIATIRDFAVRDLREILRRGRRPEGGTGWTDPTI